MKVFEPGARVRRIGTDQIGTVDIQFEDGFVFLKLDDGQPAQLDVSALEEVSEEQPVVTPAAAS